jgi:hypothetical protein
MFLSELEFDIEEMLYALKLPYKKMSIVKDISVQYLIEDFGLIVCGIDRKDYSQIDSAVQNVFEGWKLFHITTRDVVTSKKDDLIWELMRAGYLTWIRQEFPSQFKNLIVGQNFNLKIINERLKVWNGEPRFKFFIEMNLAARSQSAGYILSLEPGFFDYMP